MLRKKASLNGFSEDNVALLDYFRSPKKATASVAKERLQIIVAHERSQRGTPDYLPQLKQDILDVIRKYVHISADQVQVQFEQNEDDLSVLELNVTLPDDNRR
jgi:cell division topological specificity factor